MKQKSVRLLFLQLSALCVLASTIDRKSPANIVYYEPDLSLEYSNDIHAYAWSHKLPLPYYDSMQTPYSNPSAFSSFLQMQTHVHATSHQARDLSVKPALIEMKTATKVKDEGIGDAIRSFIPGAGAVMDTVSGAVRSISNSGLSDSMNDAGSLSMPPMSPYDSPFNYPTAQRTGTFGIGNPIRRAVYGSRRRRQPLSFGLPRNSANPWKRPNDPFRTPEDVLFGRVKDDSQFGSESNYGGPRIIGGGLRDAYYPPSSFSAGPPAGDSFYPSAGNRLSGDMFIPRFSPQSGGPSPFVTGDNTFFDFYNGGYRQYPELKAIVGG